MSMNSMFMLLLHFHQYKGSGFPSIFCKSQIAQSYTPQEDLQTDLEIFDMVCVEASIRATTQAGGALDTCS